MNRYRSIVARAGLVLAVAVGLALGTAAKADAAFIAYICNDVSCLGGDDVIVTDGGAGDLAPGVAGNITFTGALGGFAFILNASQSKPALGSAASPVINIDYSGTSLGAASAYLYASDTDFTGVGMATVHSNASVPDPNITTTSYLYGGNSNLNLDLSNLLVTIGPVAADFDLNGIGGPVGAVTPYSLTAGVLVSRASAGGVSGDVTALVPEPASMALFGIGLVGAGFAGRKRRFAQKNA